MTQPFFAPPLLLDTHAPLWFVAGDERLSTAAGRAIEDAIEVYVSVASAWEVAIKVNLGKLTLDGASPEAFFDEQMSENRFGYFPVAPRHAFQAASLPMHHRDPFDRMIIAQALSADMILVTKENFAPYGVRTLW